jgi:hypothetical protein
MDLSETSAPRSDQLNADNLIGGPETVTITEVRAGTAEQPVEIVLAQYGPGRPYKPGRSMQRVLIAGWGKDSAPYAGRRLTLYRDETVTFGGQPAPGIRISHMSDIEKPLRVNLTVTRGKRAPHTVQPLPDAPAPRDWAAEIAVAGTDTDALKALGNAAIAAKANPDIISKIRAAVAAASEVPA